MKTKAISTVCKVLGVGHFVSQSVADLLLNTEGNLQEKHLGINKVEAMQSRIDATASRQDKLLAMYAKAAAKATTITSKS